MVEGAALEKRCALQEVPRVRIPPSPPEPVFPVSIILMHIMNKVGLVLLSPLFIFLLFATALSTGFNQIATHPDKVKKLISDSGIYSTVVPGLVKQQGTIEIQGSTVPVSSPEVQSAINKAITPGTVQQNAEGAIDNVYLWLDGKTDQPALNFNLAGQKSIFADSFAANVQQNLASLPPCSAAQSAAIFRAGTFDAVNATCMPRNKTPAAAAQQVKDYVNSNESFLDKANINSAELKNEAGLSPFDQGLVQYIPEGYQAAKNSYWILLILTITVGTAIVFLSRTRKVGLRFVGINLIIVGAIMIIFTIVLKHVTTNTVIPKIKIESAALQTAAGNFINELVEQIIKNYRVFGGLYVLLGSAAIGTVIYMNRKAPPSTPNPQVKKKP